MHIPPNKINELTNFWLQLFEAVQITIFSPSRSVHENMENKEQSYLWCHVHIFILNSDFVLVQLHTFSMPYYVKYIYTCS